MNKRLNDQVYSQWIARPEGQRTGSDAIEFSDDLWNSGTRLARTQADHYQHVMSVIRLKIID